MHIDDDALQRVLGQLAQHDRSGLDIGDAVAEIVGAMPKLFDVEGAGVLLVDDQQVLRHVASTDSSAHLLEAVQETTGRGPCVEALVENVTVSVGDLAEDERWPDLAQVLVPNGVRAVLGLPVRVGGTSVGSVNVYRSNPYKWDDSDEAALDAFRRLVERLLAAVVSAERSDAVVRQLQHALESRVAIERAVGVLVATEGIDPVTAFEQIRQAARSTRRTVHEIAHDIVDRRGLREGPPG